MLWVGLTGCMGCGKSTVAQILRERHNCTVISADEISHEVLKTDKEVQQKIAERFNLKFENISFQEYRNEIAKKVFGKPIELTFLEQLLHPKIRKKVEEIKAKLAQDHKIVIYDVPLLFEKNMQPLFDKVLGVFSDPEIQKQRLMSRNNWSEDEIKRRLKSQLANEIKIQGCDYVIYNDSNLEHLTDKVDAVYKKLLKSN